MALQGGLLQFCPGWWRSKMWQ